MIMVSIEYEGGLLCKATHGPSGVTLQTDAPVDNHSHVIQPLYQPCPISSPKPNVRR
jgi:hypothetical protein